MQTVPDEFEPGSDVANLSILGYHPARFYTGRGPLEAVNMGVDLTDDQIAYRCNLVTIKDGVMPDFRAGHITSAEGAALLGSLQPAIPSVRVEPGILVPEPARRPARRRRPGARRRTTSSVSRSTRISPPALTAISCSRAWPRRRRSSPITRSTRPGSQPGNRQRLGSGPGPGAGGLMLPLFSDRFGVAGGMISARLTPAERDRPVTRVSR